MSAYFTAQLDLQRSSENGGCFRSEREGECLDQGVDLDEDSYPGLFLEICRACHRARIVRVPAHLAEAASVAGRLARLKEGGAVFSYPDGLTVMEWCCLEALQMGRANDDEAARRSDKERQESQRREAELREAITR